MLWSQWKPLANSAWGSLNQLNSEINRLFDRWTEHGPRGQAFPLLNLWEEGETVVVEAELPGLDLNDLEIFVTGQNQLTIKGQRKAPELGKNIVHRQEREFGTFVRTVSLPFPVDDAKVEARFENGVLNIRLPKHEAARPRKINIKSV